MRKVTGLNELAKTIEAIETIKKINKKYFESRVNELIKEGIEPKLAKIMVKTYIDYKIY